MKLHRLLGLAWRKSPSRIRSFGLRHGVVPFLRYLNILVTSRCNLRCQFCNIGAHSAESENPDVHLTVENFRENLFNGRYFYRLLQVHISGGEPFLRNDLIDLCDLFAAHCPNADISIATNGVLTKRIVDFVEKISSRGYHSRIKIGISLDGIGDVHDTIRGLKGTYNHVQETIDTLMQCSPGFLRSLSFTIIPENFRQLPAVFELAQKKNLEFYFRMAAESAVYYGDNRGDLTLWKEPELDELEKIIKNLFPPEREGTPPTDVRSIFIRDMVSAYKISKRHYDCFSGLCSVFIDLEGNIRPCNMLNVKFGNIGRHELMKALKSNEAAEIRRYIAQRKCFCWIECETLNSWSTAEWLGIPIREHLRIYDEYPTKVQNCAGVYRSRWRETGI